MTKWKDLASRILVTDGPIRSAKMTKYVQVQEENGQVTIFVLDERILLTNEYT